MATHADSLIDALQDSSRPVFLFGCTPPREGTSIEKTFEACSKFASRSSALATDGFIVYDIQEEGGRATTERPFPFRKTVDPALFASFFPEVSGKQCVVYKCAVEDSVDSYNAWLDTAINQRGHRAFNLVGAASSNLNYTGPTLEEAGALLKKRDGCAFGCVCIPERHTKKGNEDENMYRKMQIGAEWFITQGVFAAEPVIKLLTEYSDLCRARGVSPKKVVLTFAPCGRAKTMTFIKWLGMHVPESVESRIFAAANPVSESVDILCELLSSILLATGNTGIPLGINVESLSIFKEEIDAAHELFQRLQTIVLNNRGSPWAVRWFCVRRMGFMSSKTSDETLNRETNDADVKLVGDCDRSKEVVPENTVFEF